MQAKSQPKSRPKPRIHEAEDDESTKAASASETPKPQAPDQALKAALRAQFGSAQVVWSAFSKKGSIGKKEIRTLIKKALPLLSKEDAKLLRKNLPKKIALKALSKIMGESEETAEMATNSESSHLAPLHVEIPKLPSSFRSRPHAHEQLVTALLDSAKHSTTVTAPKSRVSSQGMGGVGKTMLTAAVVRDERVRQAFPTICWINMSQQPDLLILQQRLYEQVSGGESIPSSAKSVENQVAELQKLCLSKTLLIVLDDVVRIPEFISPFAYCNLLFL